MAAYYESVLLEWMNGTGWVNKLAGETAGQPGGLSEYVCCSDATEMCKQLYDHKDKKQQKNRNWISQKCIQIAKKTNNKLLWQIVNILYIKSDNINRWYSGYSIKMMLSGANLEMCLYAMSTLTSWWCNPNCNEPILFRRKRPSYPQMC